MPNGDKPVRPIDSLKVSLDAAVKANDSLLIAEYYQKIGDYYHFSHDFSKSFNYYEKSLGIFGMLEDSLNYYKTSQNFANYHLQSEQYFEAKKIHKKALSYYLRNNNSDLAAATYHELAKLVEELGNHETVLQYLDESDGLNQYADTVLTIKNLLVKASVFSAIEYNEKAIFTINRAKAFAIAIDDEKLIQRVQFELAIQYYFMGQYKKAVDIFEEIVPVAIAKHDPKLRRRVYKYFSKSYKAMEDFAEAYPYLERYTVLNDSILNVNRLKMINKLTIQYQSKQRLAALDALKKEHKIGEIRAQKQLVTIYSFLVGLAAILISIYFLIRFFVISSLCEASRLDAFNFC